ncbi:MULTISPECIES: sensor histidine kinase [Alicyclobacillus]|uniref:Signal transduction histidine-protein kinase/phosphatase MprB n=1 Tax=Alicyclobacillus acidoterrestris (strain ATCC 49025 / DSM 3922 / CIP 106132 / NCIMB 13137 / GD3B) TaxID=1356854 RepID=A0A9E6ZHT4_ALIAG|nr:MULTISPECIES: HAMP domain-containing sensor histidine kinase [Alicyclobacillus]UNO49168.1 HAMP domain-containing histidine kinase [Alicyclobacillus acidoterrestris]
MKEIPMCFSIRTKTLLVLVSVMVMILVLSNALYYWSTKSILEQRITEQNRLVSQQLNLEIGQARRGETYIDNLLGTELRMAAIAAEHQLNPDAAKVTNAQLREVAKNVGVSEITLFQPTVNDIVGVKSSDPKEVGLSTKQMNLWYKAFQDLLKGKPQLSTYGTAMKDFWTGPFANATSDPTKVDKWGYYYDGSTNYIIDPFIESSSLEDYADDVGTDTFIQQLLKSEPAIVGLTVLNQNFGTKPIQYRYKQTSWVDVANQPVMYGKYTYQNKALDVAEKNAALRTQKIQTVLDDVHGHKVVKTFMPESQSGTKYVVEVVTDYGTITRTLHKQLHNSLMISLVLLVLIVVIAYFASSLLIRPIREIADKVNRLANHDFNEPVVVRRNDEIGDLANRVNVMSRSLYDYLRECIRRERGQGVDYLRLVTQSMVHELKTPLVAMKFALDFLPKVEPELSERGVELVHRMKLAGQHADNVVHEFNEFLKNGHVVFQSVPVVDIVRDALRIVGPIADKHAVSTQLQVAKDAYEVKASVDKEKLCMVLVNLMKNGIEAIPPDALHKSVCVKLHVVENYIHLDVQDSGTGIPKDEWETIFTPFRSSKQNGVGLGLAFCGFIVLAHGGHIGVQDSGETGTTIRITLPIAHEAH